MKLLYFIIIITAYFVNAKLNHVNYNNVRTDVVANIIKNYFKLDKRTTIVLVGNVDESLIQDVNKEIDAVYVIMNNKSGDQISFSIKRPNNARDDFILYKSNMIIIFAEKAEDITKYIVDIRRTIYWNNNSKIMVVLNENANALLLSRVFFAFWWYKSLNALILYENKSLDKIKIVTYTPFYGNNNEDKFLCFSEKEPQYFDDYDIFSFINCSKQCTNYSEFAERGTKYVETCIKMHSFYFEDDTEIDLYPNKIANMQKYPMHVGVISCPPLLLLHPDRKGKARYSGMDGHISYTVSAYMNFTIIETGDQNLSSTEVDFSEWYNLLVEVSSRRTDIFFNGNYLLPYYNPEIDALYPHASTGMCFATHATSRIPTYLTVLRILDVPSILAVGSVMIFMIIIFGIIIKNRFNNKRKESIILGGLYVIQITASVSVNKLKLFNRMSERIIVAAFILFSFIIFFYVVAMATCMLMVPKYYKNIDNLKDLSESNIIVEGYPGFESFLMDSDDPVIEDLLNKYVPTNDLFCPKTLEAEPYKACWVDCGIGKYFSDNLLDEQNKKIVHLGKQRVRSSFHSFVVTRDSPFVNEFEKWIKRLTKAGLPEKWRKSSYRGTKIGEAETTYLNMAELLGLFTLFILGMCISTLVFIIEYICSYYTSRKNNFIPFNT